MLALNKNYTAVVTLTALRTLRYPASVMPLHKEVSRLRRVLEALPDSSKDLRPASVTDAQPQISKDSSGTFANKANTPLSTPEHCDRTTVLKDFKDFKAPAGLEDM